MPEFYFHDQRHECDSETLAVLQSILPDANRTRDYSAVQAIFALGLQSRRIKRFDQHGRDLFYMGFTRLDSIRGRLSADHAKDESDAELERVLGPCVCGDWLVPAAKTLRDAGLRLVYDLHDEAQRRQAVADGIIRDSALHLDSMEPHREPFECPKCFKRFCLGECSNV